MVLRSSAMGDVAMLPHALRALKSAYPDVRLTVVTQKLFQPFFAGLDVEFLYIDIKNEHKGIAGLWRLARQAKRLGVDSFADVHDVLRSKIFRFFMWVQGVKVRKIRKGRFAKWLRMGSGNSECVQPLKHTVIRYCDTIRRFGFEFDNPLPPAKPKMENPMGEKSGVWVGVAPFSAHKGKIYPLDKMREVVASLSRSCERVFIHSGGGEELEYATSLEQEFENVTALFGKLRFKGELELISHLDCIISMDSLAMHMASLVNTPVVSVWGATHPKLGFLGYGCSEEGIVQINDLSCRPCSVYGKKPCKHGDYRCMERISPQEILHRVENLM